MYQCQCDMHNVKSDIQPVCTRCAVRRLRRVDDSARSVYDGNVAVEPRHATWFSREGNAWASDLTFARVAANPAVVSDAGSLGGDTDVIYFRLHGSPRIYHLSYSTAFVDALREQLQGHINRGAQTWCIFDNTAVWAATENALKLISEAI